MCIRDSYSVVQSADMTSERLCMSSGLTFLYWNTCDFMGVTSMLVVEY